MKLGRILVLLVLLAGLVAYLHFVELPQAEKEGKKDKLVAVDKDAVVGVVLAYPDHTIELKKVDNGWRLVKPLDAPADDNAVKSLVGTLTDAQVEKTLDEAPTDLSTFGLDKPTPLVTLSVASGTAPPTIAVGKNTPIGSKSYVRKGDEPKVYVTTSSLQFALNKQPKDLRDKDVFHFQDDDVQRVDITGEKGGTTSLVRKGKDDWSVEPGDHPADATDTRSYLSSLRATRAVDFPDDAPADLGKYGLLTPRLTVTIATGKDGADKQTLLIGGETTAPGATPQSPQKQLYAKRADAPTVYALGEWSLRTLDKTGAQLRDKTVLGFDPGKVGEFTVERKDGGTVTVARAESSWKVSGVGDKKPNDAAISRFLEDLKDLHGSDIAAEPVAAKDLAAWGLDAPDVRIGLTDKDGKPLGAVLSAQHDGKRYVMRDGGSTVFEARDYIYQRLDKKAADFVAMEVAPPAAGAVPPVSLPAADDGE